MLWELFQTQFKGGGFDCTNPGRSSGRESSKGILAMLMLDTLSQCLELPTAVMLHFMSYRYDISIRYLPNSVNCFHRRTTETISGGPCPVWRRKVVEKPVSASADTLVKSKRPHIQHIHLLGGGVRKVGTLKPERKLKPKKPSVHTVQQSYCFIQNGLRVADDG